MALTAQSMFLYGYSVGVSNQNLDFLAASGGPILTAQVPFGDYSLTTLLSAVVVALETADSINVYTAVADRSLLGGTQNRVSLTTLGTYFSLLFGSGPNSTTSIAGMLGFNPTDYTGATGYTGALTTGISLIPDFIGYNYNDEDTQAKVFGAVNVASSGLKESVTFAIQEFVDVEFKYEMKAKVSTAWKQFFTWAIQQKPFDFTREITNPSHVFPYTLEKTGADGKGLAYKMNEMLPDFPNFYTTGAIQFRLVLDFNETVYMS